MYKTTVLVKASMGMPRPGTLSSGVRLRKYTKESEFTLSIVRKFAVNQNNAHSLGHSAVALFRQLGIGAYEGVNCC
jgi:hypothetical protein